MGLWSVIVPRAATNLVSNPSLETATTGYTAVGGSVARSTTYQRRGLYSLAVTPTSGTTDGVYFGTVSLTSGTTYYFTVDFLGVSSIPYKIYFADTSGNLEGTATTLTGSGAWQRVSVSWTCDSSTTYRLYMTKNSHASTDVFYVDGLQCEATYETTYLDGDQDDCTWTGTAHASTSSRSGQSRTGGRVIDLETTYSVNVVAEIGIGVPSARHEVSEQALLAGAQFLGRKVLPRTIDLVCQLKGTNYANLHSLRAALWDALKPDLVKGDQAMWLKYTGANTATPVYCKVVYDSGLEGGNPDMYLDTLTVRFIAYDPWWYEDGNTGQAITATLSVSNANYIIGRVNGTWQALGSGMNDEVLAIAFGLDKKLYAGGGFTTAGGTNVQYVAQWDGSAWSAVGGTATDADVYCFAIDPAGGFYMGGNFTSCPDATAANRIAYWDGTSGSGVTWYALGTGLNGICRALVLDQSGIVYAGGNFTTAGGTTVNYIGKWDGSTWATVDGTSCDQAVYALCIGPDGRLYAGGDFTTAPDGTSASRVAVFDGTSWAALGAGLSDTCQALYFGSDGYLYAAGRFATAGGVAAPDVARWNGSAWEAMGTGLDLYAYVITEHEGMVYVGGQFSSAGGLTTANRVAMFNGYSWVNLDVDLPGSPYVYALAFSDDNFYIGYTTSGTATTSYKQTVTVNGSKAVQPVLRIKRSGGTSARLEWLRNETTGKTIYFDYALQSGEELIVDMRTGRQAVTSSYWGAAWRALVRGSDFANFELLPGANELTCVITTAGSPTMVNALLWTEAHWMADGAA